MAVRRSMLDNAYEKLERNAGRGISGVVAVAMKCGMKGLMEDPGLTKYAPVYLASEPLDAVPLLVHAPEVVPPYIAKARESG